MSNTLKKINQIPDKMEKIKNRLSPQTNTNVEVVPQTEIKVFESELAESQSCVSTKDILNERIPNVCHVDQLKIILNDNNTSKSIRNKKLNINVRKCGNGCAEILVTDTLKENQKKTLTETNSSSLQFQSSVQNDKQLLLTEPFKRLKSTQTILSNDRINTLRRHAQEALRQHKIFTIRGNYNSIRHALKARGWIEKLEIHRKSASVVSTNLNIYDVSQYLLKRKTGETQQQLIEKIERQIMSRYIENNVCDFLWISHREKGDYLYQNKNPNMQINKFSTVPFTNKENLNTFLRNTSAFYEEGVSDVKFPRCFNVWTPEEFSEFIENFKLTACIAFVQWLVDKYNGGGFDAVFSANGKIDLNSIDFAFKRCLEFIENCQHNDIDNEESIQIWEDDWNVFLNQHYQITHDGLKILSDSENLAQIFITKGSHILDNIQQYWPQHTIDGYQNLWIIKPANKCRGRGIQLSNNLNTIKSFVNPSIASKSRYVIQKYMERPLIIHQTKFDIRQWFLISSLHPLMIWMYKECYLRFSSQKYTLMNHHESVHLTNHAIQMKYTNNAKRDKRLPNENMWDSYSFQAYLRQINKQDFWLKQIYPSMCKAIVATILASQDHMERSSNRFELFGADFMICENFYPWLIEINSNPDLAATTSVTARMCPQFLEDVIKVMIDRRNDANADVGNFELIYRQNIPPTPAYMGINIIIKGNQIFNRTNAQHSCFGYKRKENTLQTRKLFKHRNSLAITNVSQIHNPMPAFNASQYVEKCMISLPNSDRFSATLSNSKKDILSISNFIPAKNPRKSLIKSRAKTSFQKSPFNSISYILKRNRSCGLKLPINSFADYKNAKRSKLLVTPYLQQRTLHSYRNLQYTKNYALKIRKSADDIMEPYSQPKNTLEYTKNLYATRKNLNNFKPQLKMKSNKDESNTSTLHAIGKGIWSWNNKQR